MPFGARTITVTGYSPAPRMFVHGRGGLPGYDVFEESPEQFTGAALAGKDETANSASAIVSALVLRRNLGQRDAHRATLRRRDDDKQTDWGPRFHESTAY